TGRARSRSGRRCARRRPARRPDAGRDAARPIDLLIDSGPGRSPMRGRGSAPGFRAFCVVALAVLAAPARLRAQAADVPIFDDDKIVASLTEQSVRLRTEGRLVEMATLARQRGERARCRLALARPAREKLTPPQVCVAAHRSTWIVGVVFHCTSCAEWHFSGATGYAISADGAIATCAHVVAPEPDSKDEFVVAADPDS